MGVILYFVQIVLWGLYNVREELGLEILGRVRERIIWERFDGKGCGL